MKKEHCHLVFSTREHILANLIEVSKKGKPYQDIVNNVTGSYIPNMPDDDKILEDLGDEYHSTWYGLISNVESLLTSITNVIINFKRDYIDLNVTSTQGGAFDFSIPEVIISFEGIEVSEVDRDAVQKLCDMLLDEFNPKVV